jgi:hypothetical protein
LKDIQTQCATASLKELDIYLGADRLYILILSIHCLTEEQSMRRQRKQKWVQKKKGKALTSRTLQKQAYNYLFTNIPQEEISL